MFENCEAAVRVSDEKGPIWEKEFRFKPQPKYFQYPLTQIKKKKKKPGCQTSHVQSFARKLLILNLLSLKV
jgi:hypothetical protein